MILEEVYTFSSKAALFRTAVSVMDFNLSVNRPQARTKDGVPQWKKKVSQIHFFWKG